MKILRLKLFIYKKSVYSHQYPLDASFHKFLGPSINNDNANLCIWSLLKLLKIVHIGKYLILLRNGMKPILKVLLRKYISALSSFLLNINIIRLWFWSWIEAMSLT